MRGDSLRDFYAKTLAVMGLGLLACAGAIVDYWPVNEELPSTPAAAGLVREAPALAQDLTRVIPAPEIRTVVAQPRPADFVSVSVSSVEAEQGVQIALEAAPLPENLVIVDTIYTAAAPPDEMLDLAVAPVPGASSEESRRLIGDALKRTKARIAAARVLFSDAMTGFVGAFRKVSPFFTTTAFVPGLD